MYAYNLKGRLKYFILDICHSCLKKLALNSHLLINCIIHNLFFSDDYLFPFSAVFCYSLIYVFFSTIAF